MLIDEATITVTSGAGGDGRVAFFVNYGRPAGGDGGKGGDVYAKVNIQLASLARYVQTNHFTASNGGPGQALTRSGKDAKDLVLEFPSGTQLTDLHTQETLELTNEEPVLLCKGGKGGWGNAQYSHTHHGVFDQANKGRPSEERKLRVVMRLIADCGLIGLPNAGKSSLLNVLTNAGAKVANYPFTTLEPNLGILHKLSITNDQLRITNGGKRIVIADIPGLIEGASTGKGLGIKFLKHIEKVNLMLHCISCETTDLKGDYEKVRKELGEYNPELLNKKEIVFLTKSDILQDDNQRLKKLLQTAQKLSGQAIAVSVIDDTAIAQVAEQIFQNSKI